MNADVARLLGDVFAATAPAGVVSVYLFGSQADGRGHRESDVDVGVLLDRRVHQTSAARFEVRLALMARLGAAIRAPRSLDLVVLNEAPPHLVRRIMTEGHQVFCADVEEDHAARRTALSRAADLEPFLRRTRAIKLDALAR